MDKMQETGNGTCWLLLLFLLKQKYNYVFLTILKQIINHYAKKPILRKASANYNLKNIILDLSIITIKNIL